MSRLFFRVSHQFRQRYKVCLITGAVVLYTLPFIFFNGFSNAAVFAKFDGIDGESRDTDHKDWIDILNFNFGVKRSAGTEYKVEIDVSAATKPIDKASPRLMVQCATDDPIPTGSIEYTKEIRGEDQIYLKIEMRNLVISSYNFGGSSTAVGKDLVPIDSVGLDFKQVTMTYIPFDPLTGEPMEPVVGVCNFDPAAPQ